MESFKTYFTRWLYSKDGYYSNYKQIGKEGDFFTSVSVSSFFGGAIANKIIKTIEEGFLSKDTSIVEIGAHKGYLLADIIQFIYTLRPQLLESLDFIIIEKYEDLQKEQKKYLEQSFQNHIKIKHYEDISKLKLDSAFIIANEIFDCFPCDLLHTNKDGILQKAFMKNHKISFLPCEDKSLEEHCKKYDISKGEVSLSYELFIENLCTNIKKFEFLSFDYGEKYPRNDFSIRIYEKHKVYPLFEENLNLEELYKKSDITYDVHFDFIIDLFKNRKIKEINFSSQLKALVEFGIIELLEILKANVSEEIYLKELHKVKILLDPQNMGERFKVLNVRKEFE